MPPDWHNNFRRWAKPLSDTADQKAENAERMIRDAIRESNTFNNVNVEVYATGSYRNNTNTTTDSDVDVAVVLEDLFFYDPLPQGLTPDLLDFQPATYTFDQFRKDVEVALRAKFKTGFTPGDKAFDIHENTYRLDADVAVFFKHRLYDGTRDSNGWRYFEGVEMLPRGGSPPRIVNWHKQHHANGVAKNNATGGRFKRVTRILKEMRPEILTNGSAQNKSAAADVASFFVECLVYNAPTALFNAADDTYYEDVKNVVGWVWNQINGNTHQEFKEVSEMKSLFGDGQPWTSAQAKAFLGAVWAHVGFGTN